MLAERRIISVTLYSSNIDMEFVASNENEEVSATKKDIIKFVIIHQRMHK